MFDYHNDHQKHQLNPLSNTFHRLFLYLVYDLQYIILGCLMFKATNNYKKAYPCYQAITNIEQTAKD